MSALWRISNTMMVVNFSSIYHLDMLFSAGAASYLLHLGARQIFYHVSLRAKGVPMEFIATCPTGFEALLAQELTELHTPGVRALTGQVSFSGELADAYRVCLWSHLASRILCVLGRFPSTNSDELYAGISAIAWEDHISPASTIAIKAHGTNAQLKNTQFIAQRAKDALVDRLFSRRGTRLSVDTHSPDIRLDIRLHKDHATCAIDLVGDPLFNRGWELAPAAYRAIQPLRADYAAALLAAGGWKNICCQEEPALVSLFAGSGNLFVEATTLAAHVSPSVLRSSWAHRLWLAGEQSCWESLFDVARASQEKLAGTPITLFGWDERGGWEQLSRQTLRAAGIHASGEPFLALYTKAAKERLAAAQAAGSLVVLDTTAYSRSGFAGEVRAISAGSAVADSLHDRTLVSLSASEMLPKLLGRTPATRIATKLGQAQGAIEVFEPEQNPVHTQAKVRDTQVGLVVSNSEQFAARLAKVYKQRRKWTAREDISCYRLYDADLPDYNVAVDLYEVHFPRGKGEGPAQRWAYISEYAPPKSVDAELARQRLFDVVSLVGAVCEIEPSHIALRTRERSRGGSQYGKTTATGSARALPHTYEGGLAFEVNFSDYLDTGLFLDHRETRALVREAAKKISAGGHFCNLFAYTGSATCYAADGGATHTTTVDMSNTYLSWAKRNMELNGFTERTHEFVQADVLRWINDERHSSHRYELVFCDPPTFSNSSRMGRRSFDVQRDHVELLIGVSRILTRDGMAIFSCNLRNFTPDLDALAKAGVSLVDITKQTIPPDFERNQRIHHCYELRRVRP